LDDHLLRIFKLELQEQCEQALEAAAELSKPRSEVGVWSEVQSIIISAGNAAKLLWGSQGPEKKLQRKPLRDSVGVGDGWALRSRDVRNAFEHFDERLESWYAQSESKNLAIRNIGDPDLVGFPGLVHFGFFNTKTGEVTFWKWSISLHEVLGEMENIYVRLLIQ
jgi:hypothetical protein